MPAGRPADGARLSAGVPVVYQRRMGLPHRCFAILATCAALASCTANGSEPSVPDAAFDAVTVDVDLGDAGFDVTTDARFDAGDANADADADATSDADEDAPEAEAGDAATDADASDADADAGAMDASDASDADASGPPTSRASDLAAGAGVARSSAYQLSWTLGPTTPGAPRATSSKYRLQGGVVGANGSPP